MHRNVRKEQCNKFNSHWLYFQLARCPLFFFYQLFQNSTIADKCRSFQGLSALFLCLVTSTIWSQNKRVSRFMVDHFYVKFGDTSCSGFWDIVQINRHTTDKQMPLKIQPLWLPLAWVTYPFSTNMATSEIKGQWWRAIPILWMKASNILTSTLAAFLFSSHPKGKGIERLI